MKPARITNLCCATVVLTLSWCSKYDAVKNNKVLVVSFDGFRWDYPVLFNTPNFRRIRSQGVYAREGTKPVFVTNTFPNHFSIVTGVYAESHGIVNNNMYNSSSKASFNIGNSKDAKWWQGGSPIWITAEAQGIRTGVYFWVGSEVPIRERRPSIYRTYDEKVPYRDRVDTVVQWLASNTVDLALLYFAEPDKTGHDHGIQSQQFRKAVENVTDGTLGYLLQQLERNFLTDEVNLLVVSDHGMTNFNQSTSIIRLTRYVNDSCIEKVSPSTGATVAIFPKAPCTAEELYKNLIKNVTQAQFYLRDNIPLRYHYRNNKLIAPLIAIADEGFLISQNSTTTNQKALHGYSNDLQSMRPAFAAYGPDFKKNYSVKDFQNIDIYPLLCHLLGIKPEPNNGSFSAVEPLLRSGAKSFSLSSSITMILSLNIIISFIIGN